MNKKTAELTALLAEKGELLKRLQGLLQREQGCITSLDIAGLEANQQEISGAMERLARLSEDCRRMIGSLGAELGIAGNQTLSPIIARLGQPEQKALREAQAAVAACSKALAAPLALNRRLLEDSLKVVNGSVSFFNRLLSPGETYGVGGSLVAGRGASRFVCKEA